MNTILHKFQPNCNYSYCVFDIGCNFTCPGYALHKEAKESLKLILIISFASHFSFDIYQSKIFRLSLTIKCYEFSQRIILNLNLSKSNLILFSRHFYFHLSIGD